jgi:hypothetical protein
LTLGTVIKIMIEQYDEIFWSKQTTFAFRDK